METDRESRFIVAGVILGDLIVVNLLFCVISIFGQIPSAWDLVHECVILTLCYIVSVSLFGGVNLYRRRVRVDQVITTVFGNVVRFFVIWFAMQTLMENNTEFSWSFVLYIISTFFMLSLYRVVFQFILKGLRSRGKHKCTVVFVGSTRNMQELYDEMMLNTTTGYDVLGYFDNEPNPNFAANYLGNCDTVNDYLLVNKVQRLYCSLPSAMKDTILSIIACCESHLVRFYSVPNLRNYLSRRVNLEIFSNTPVLSIRTEPLSKIDSKIIKRTFDIVVSFVFLVTVFPIVFLIFGTLIKISSSGPIFFRQKRHGLDGKEFFCYKFRSMKQNVDADKLQASEDDPRKTKVGDFMRRTSIDELPQFINVLIGNMSIVGPRPHMLAHTEEYSQLINTYMVRHLIKPGITGWAQVTGFRGETKELSEMEGRVKADIWYMEHWTFMLDLYIMFKTVANVVGKKDTKAF